ncbi:helix-turn-helix domain-containing protein [Eubacteriales bacterium OttesenSCG-928-N13]|nr:helix-turn-helix domain-containing protein [Eubacteriales bacterium OttesenSCG-928-N13]
MDVYERIDQLIHDRGTSRRKLAQMAGITPNSLNSSFSRKSNLSSETVAKLAKALQVDVGYLINGCTDSELIAERQQHDAVLIEQIEMTPGMVALLREVQVYVTVLLRFGAGSATPGDMADAMEKVLQLKEASGISQEELIELVKISTRSTRETELKQEIDRITYDE